MTTEARIKTNRLVALWWALAVGTAAVLPYLPSLGGGFVLDDNALIVADPLAHSLRRLPQAFTTDFLHGYLSTERIYYRPLSTISFQANYSLSGPNPFAFRVTNVLLNVAVCLLVFFLARRLTKSLFAAGVAGLVFAALPCHSESVAWISGRTELISSLFLIASFLVLMAGSESRSGLSLRLGAGFMLLFACALLAKENATVLPVLLAGYVWIFGSSVRRKEWMKWGIVIGLPLIAYFIVRHLVGCIGISKHISLVAAERLFGIGMAYTSYLRMLFIPRESSIVYDVFPIALRYPVIGIAAWLTPAGLAALTIYLRKRAPVVAFGTFWIMITLLPFVNLAPSFGPLPAERYTFLPSVGSAIILGWAAWRMYEYRPKSIRTWPILIGALICWFVLYCAALTISSTRHYHSNTGWAQAIAETDVRFPTMHAQAGQYLSDAGLLKESESEYDKAIARDAHNELDLPLFIDVSRLKRRMGEPERAVQVLNEATQRFGANAEIEFNLGLSYVQAKRMDEAVAAFSRCVELDPKSEVARRDLARAKARQ